jgi:hypothetical protein
VVFDFESPRDIFFLSGAKQIMVILRDFSRGPRPF